MSSKIKEKDKEIIDKDSNTQVMSLIHLYIHFVSKLLGHCA